MSPLTDAADRLEARHDPMYMRGGGASWCQCSCGWLSTTYTTPTGAQLAHGEHLLTLAQTVTSDG